ncbi:MAG: histidine phosphotransferase [Hyphomicrobiales bacterium]|nr:histidine phosphotransferase [Hyphomicrobiales bacterium]OQW85062.1 MAG: hypothetical protein BVN31_00975 [Proteobacteria bacterium ST_bin15]
MSDLVPISLDAIELSALLSSWICHDIISPAGAVYNALEILEDELGEPTGVEAFGHAKKSAAKTSTKLQFSRIAFGASGSLSAGVDSGEAERLAIAYGALEKVTVTWSGPRLILPKNQIKLMLNLLLLSLEAVPRGGAVHVTIGDQAERPEIQLSAEGLNARIPKGSETFLRGLIEKDAVMDARAVQPYFTGLLAKAVGVDILVRQDGERIIIETKVPTPQN